MEYTMKKALCVGLALAFAPMAVQAQSTTATVTATATVVANLTVAQLSILNFGELSQGDAPDVQVETAATAPQTRGEFQITHNSPVAISVTPPSVLTGPNSSTIGVSFECGLSSTQGGPTTGIADQPHSGFLEREFQGSSLPRCSWARTG
jgi:hypothetical protein